MRTALKVILVLSAMALAGLTLYAVLFTAVAAQIKGLLTILAVNVLVLPPGTAETVAWIVALLVAEPAICFGWKIFTGRLRAVELALTLISVCATLAGIRIATADWLF